MGLESFPENIAGFKLISVTDNESAHPGLGYTAQYISSGVRFSIYEYSNGLAAIPDGIDSIAARDQFKQSVDYVLSISPVAKVVPSSGASQRFIVGRTPLLHMVFSYPDQLTDTRENVWSHLYLTASRNNFIKIRCTYSAAEYSSPNYSMQKQFLEQFCSMIQPQTDMTRAQTVEAPQMSDDTFPRDLLPLHYGELAGGIPVNGGWGYSADDAVIIGENDSRELGWLPFDSEGLKLLFVEKRIAEELVHTRADDEKCVEIRWNMLAQKSVTLDGNEFDVMTFEVSAITGKNLAALRAEYPQAGASAAPDRDEYWRKQSSLRFRYVIDYWFQVKKSMPQLLHALFNEFTSWHRGMALNHGVVPKTLSGVAADGRQFLVQLTGIRVRSTELHAFMQTVLAAENAIAYATGSLMGHTGEQGELVEEIYIVSASSTACIQGFATLQKDADNAITGLGDFSRYEDCCPEDSVHTSLLAGVDAGTTAAESDRYLSVWREIKKTAQFRQR